ncbi:MAG: M48 family metalloprotease [Phycisphaerae bacterium]|nr:M48 family metalloprotease [Phycisphaerae bacterium]
MSILMELVESSWCRSLITALFHSLWQGVLIAGTLFFYLRSMSAQKPHQRYNVSVMALALMFLSLFVTWGIVQYGLDASVQVRADEFAMVDQVESNVSSGRSYRDSGQTASPDETETSQFIPQRRRGLLSKSTQWHQWFFVAWGIGFILMLLRLIVSVFGDRNIRVSAEVLADPVVERLVDELLRSMELARKITIMVSEEIVSPCVTGFVVPLLLLPVSMVNGSIPTEDLKVILAHELAHIKRNDYFVNMVQMLVEAVLFFNPAVWLISRAIRIEREVCCDTFGSKYSESPVSHARTLAHWAQKAALTGNLPGIMMPLYEKEGSGLIDRIERLICPAKMPQLKLPWHSIMTVIVIFAIGCYGLQSGTHKAVDVVSRLLTPQQRLDSMKNIAESYSSDSQSHKQEVLPNKDQVVQRTLTQANHTQGVIVAKETGEPVDGVDVLIKKIYGNKDYYKSYWDSQLKILATTDEKGFFTLNSLRNDCLYILMFRKGKRFAYAFDVSSGEDLSIELPQPYCIKGRFTGSLDPLESRDGRQVIDYRCFLNHRNVNNQAGGGDNYVPVDEEGRFEITNLSGNTIRIGHDQIGTSLGAALWNQEVVLDPTEAAGPQEKRKVVLKFDVPEGYPSPAGKVRISYVSGIKEIVGSYHRLDVPIEDYQAVFELPAPCTFRYRMEETIGYWFKEKWNNKLTRSVEPFIEHVEGIPSGAIYGVVLGPDGQEVKSAFTQVVTVQKAPYMKDRALDIELNDAGSGPARFIIPSLPIGGTYAVYTKQENRYAVSEPIKITEENPIQHITLKLREGQSFAGRVLNETGNGLAGIQYQLFYQTPWTGGSGGRTRITLPDGTFSFDDINFDMPAAYSVSIEPLDTWMPQRIDIRPDMSDKTISLEKGKRLEGVVVENKTGLPIPGVEIHANSLIRDKNILGYLGADGSTNEKGQFIFARMSAKKYRLDTAHNQARPIKEYYVMGGQNAPVVIRVDIPESSSALPNQSAQPILTDQSNDGTVSSELALDEYRRDLNALGIRLAQLGRKSFSSLEAKEELHEHIFWLIKNHSDSDIAGRSETHVRPSILSSAYGKAKALWLKQVADHPGNAKIMANAARFFTIPDRDRAKALYQEAKRIDPKNADWPQRLSHLHRLGMTSKAGLLRKQAAVKALNELEQAYALATNDEKKMYILPDLAKDAYEAGQIDKASTYARQLLNNPPAGHNYGNTIHQGNLILGRIALDKNKIEVAKRHLLNAAKTPGSPVLGSFGPSMTLANELLKKGERDVVIEYFDLCNKFWKMGRDRLKNWKATVKQGGTPEFGSSLIR